MTAQMRLKNSITKHESRSPSPKAAGPSVPAENLSKSCHQSVKLPTQETIDKREDVKIHREPDEKYLAVLCIRSTFWGYGENT